MLMITLSQNKTLVWLIFFTNFKLAEWFSRRSLTGDARGRTALILSGNGSASNYESLWEPARWRWGLSRAPDNVMMIWLSSDRLTLHITNQRSSNFYTYSLKPGYRNKNRQFLMNSVNNNGCLIWKFWQL